MGVSFETFEEDEGVIDLTYPEIGRNLRLIAPFLVSVASLFLLDIETYPWNRSHVRSVAQNLRSVATYVL